MRPGHQGRKRGTGTLHKQTKENCRKSKQVFKSDHLRSTMQHPFFHYSYDFGGIFFHSITTIVVVMFGLNTYVRITTIAFFFKRRYFITVFCKPLFVASSRRFYCWGSKVRIAPYPYPHQISNLLYIGWRKKKTKLYSIS